MKVINKEKSLVPFKEIAIFEATEYEEAIFGSMLGDKRFYMNKGDRVRLRVSKDDCYMVGDKVDLEDIITGSNQFEFSWEWM